MSRSCVTVPAGGIVGDHSEALSNNPITASFDYHGMLETKTHTELLEKSATILIYKKGDTSDPANFRPITLQPVLSKILAIVMKKRMYEFLNKNEYIDKTR